MPQMSDILSDIKMVVDITSRVDERVKMIQARHIEIYEQLNKIMQDIAGITARTIVLESKNGTRVDTLQADVQKLTLTMERLEALKVSECYEQIEDIIDRLDRLEVHKQNWKDHLKYWGGMIIHGAWVILVCYLLYKLGLNAPPVP